MSRLRSRHIVAYVESGMSGTRDIFWIVMELLEVNTRTHNSVCRCSNSLMFSPLACALYRHATQMAGGFILWNLLSLCPVSANWSKGPSEMATPHGLPPDYLHGKKYFFSCEKATVLLSRCAHPPHCQLCRLMRYPLIT